MTAILIAYIIVSIVCMLWTLGREFILHGNYPEEMAELYTVVGFGFLWPVSIPWELYCEHKYPVGYDPRSPQDNWPLKCPTCGDTRVIYHAGKWLNMSAPDPMGAEIENCPGCGDKLGPIV